MDWSNLIVLGLLFAAYLIAIYQSWRESWGLHRKAGTTILLVGATIGLFLDNYLEPGSSLLPWVEPIGALIMFIGLSISWFGLAESNPSNDTHQA